MVVKTSKTIQIPFLWLKYATYLYHIHSWFGLLLTSLVSAKVPVCGVTPPTLCQTHLHQIQRLNPICIPEDPMTSPKTTLTSVFFCRLIALSIHTDLRSVLWFLHYGMRQRGWLSISIEQNRVQKCEENILTWDNSINQKWRDSGFY